MKKLVVLVLAVALVSASCGGDDGGSGLSCDFTPCGGDLTGTWTITRSCYDFTGLDPSGGFCPESSITSSTIAVTGTVTMESNGNYSVTTMSSGNYTALFPSSCVNGVVADCGQIGQNDPNISCSGDPTSTGCTCTVMVSNSGSDAGTWSTSGSDLTLVDANNATTTGTYCVQGNAASVRIGAQPELTLVMSR